MKKIQLITRLGNPAGCRGTDCVALLCITVNLVAEAFTQYRPGRNMDVAGR